MKLSERVNGAALERLQRGRLPQLYEELVDRLAVDDDDVEGHTPRAARGSP